MFQSLPCHSVHASISSPNVRSLGKVTQSGHTCTIGCFLGSGLRFVWRIPKSCGFREFCRTHVGVSWLSGAATHLTKEGTEDSRRETARSEFARSRDHLDLRNQGNPVDQPASPRALSQACRACFRQVSRCQLLVGELCSAQSHRCASFLHQFEARFGTGSFRDRLWITRQVIAGPTRTLVRLLENVPTLEP